MTSGIHDTGEVTRTPGTETAVLAGEQVGALAVAVVDDRVEHGHRAKVGPVGVRDGLLHWVRPDTFPPPTGRDRLLGRDGPPSPPAHVRPAIVARLVRWACRVPDQDAVPIWACWACRNRPPGQCWSRASGWWAAWPAAAGWPPELAASIDAGCGMT